MERVLRFLEQSEVFFVATVEDDQPHVRPYGFFMHYQGPLYLATGKQKAGYRQLCANPHLALCAVVEGNSWLRLKAQAVFDERPEVLKAVFAYAPYLEHLYQDPQQLAIFYLDHCQVELADKTGMFDQFTV